jgi:hypothetical protein
MIRASTQLARWSRLLWEPNPRSKIEFLPEDEKGSWNAVEIADKICDSLRSYRRDRCAIFIDQDSTDGFLRETGLQADFLDPDENMHWTGLQKQMRPKHKVRRVFVGDYDEWFRWFMKWQRFNAFHVVVLVDPIQKMVEDDRRGYFDGLLTRLLKKPRILKVIVVEGERFQPIVRSWIAGGNSENVPELKGKFGREQFKGAISSLLYGTRLSKRELPLVAANTLFSKLNTQWEAEFQYIKARPALVEMKHGKFYSAGYYGKEKVESLETPAARESIEDSQEPLPPLFKRTMKRGPSELNQDWLEGLTQALLDTQGWFTVAVLYEYVEGKTQRVIQTSESLPQIFNEHYDYEAPSEAHVFVPSRPILRRIAERLVQEGKLQKATWVREIGRPTAVYHLPGQLPFDNENRCGQCAFYVPLRRQCRIWWLLNRSYGHWNQRWSRDGARPLSAFEIHKMKNGWRIGPHSSACLRFVDKKRDYTRKAPPESCDICDGELPESPAKGATVICPNCRTRYFRLRQGRVRVLTSYEHEFRRRYQELAGVEPASDMKRLVEESQGSTASIVEAAIYEKHRHPDDDPDSEAKTVMVYPGDRMLRKDGRLYVFKKRNVESLPLAGSTLIDQGGVVSEEQRGSLEGAGMTVRSISKSIEAGEQGLKAKRYDIAPAVENVVKDYPEFLRKMALAMAQSALHATERIGSLAGLAQSDTQAFTRRQAMLTRRLARVPQGKFLAYEAMIMKEYWACYFLVLKAALQRFGPRKKARFVREFVTNPAGRARGYTAMDAAINYLHQRRLFKAKSTNVQLGLDVNPGEGFLHRKRWNPEGLGLILDLIDPFKFADREKLLEAVKDVSVNWRDFYSSTDRYGARYYYPKEEAVGVLEALSEAADKTSVSHQGAQITLVEAYRNTVSMLIQNLQAGTPLSFAPFVY